jgi:hypothetical protein
MLKQIIIIINRLWRGKTSRMSQDWRAAELENYEKETRLKAGLY